MPDVSNSANMKSSTKATFKGLSLPMARSTADGLGTDPGALGGAVEVDAASARV